MVHSLHQIMTNVPMFRKLKICPDASYMCLVIIADAVAIYVKLAEREKENVSLYIQQVANAVTVSRACHCL